MPDPHDDPMPDELTPDAGSPPIHRRGPQGLGDEAARALEQNSRSDQGSTSLEEQAFLRAWAQAKGCLIPRSQWESWILVSNHTLEHEVRFRPEDRRAVKKTWPGTFGFVPRWNGNAWVPSPASAAAGFLVKDAAGNPSVLIQPQGQPDLQATGSGQPGVAIDEIPLRGLGVREGFQAELVAQGHRLIIGEHLVALPDNADDFTGVARHQRLPVRQADIPRHAVVGHGRVDRGFCDGEKPVSSRRV